MLFLRSAPPLGRRLASILFLLCFSLLLAGAQAANIIRDNKSSGRERTSLNDGWKFSRFVSDPDSLSYNTTLKPWILPSANDFINGTKYKRPSGTPPGSKVKFVQASFDDKAWESVNLPHDWAIKGPFNAPGISGGMGRLPTNGVGWYRRKVAFSQADEGKSVFLDVDGAMSFAAVWLNGNLVGGWPYGYNSFRLDLTPYLKTGGDNLLAIRVQNSHENSRWYPGAGIYRNVWLVKTNPTHVGQYGTYITTSDISDKSATVRLVVDVQHDGSSAQKVDVDTEIREFDAATGQPGPHVVASFKQAEVKVAAGEKKPVSSLTKVVSPKLWGPAPEQKPNMYVAITSLSVNGKVVDTYETPFGIRTITIDANKGVFVNGKPVRVYGSCNHHDHGSLGAAFNTRAAERQLEMLQEMGSNSIRTSHNPPAPELLDLADRLGMLVLDEIFDTWSYAKVSDDFHTIFYDWSEADLRNFVRRDRNHPSIMAWSYGNELIEQNPTEPGFGEGSVLFRDMLRAEDPTRLSTIAMNFAWPGTPMADAVDIIGLNYQGEGHGMDTNGAFDSFHTAYPNKAIWSSESASALSTRGTYIFPVAPGNNAIVGGADAGGNDTALQVSAYELYATAWGSSPDKVFEAQDRHQYVAGEFVWTGWDYLGEPTPYDDARSSYFGIIDLAGFKKDRFFLYQARWSPQTKGAHLLPHWTWPGREGLVTPVHVFSSGDEAELFVNGKSAGRKTRGEYEYRFRWDDVVYQPGNVSVVVYKGGKEWGRDAKRTVGKAKKLDISADRTTIDGDGYDLSFITVAVVDGNGDAVPEASDAITFSISGPGEIVSTDNGDPADMTPFPSLTRKAFSGLALAIVRSTKGADGKITVTASANGLTKAKMMIHTN